ncbi:jg18613 [Pararge aegeria aegeria]|uniref:Jg18613 protein n=1 Tax=Pararge aegeria aegeria TaxID=348720 RepID=A0A8S4R3R2_9NEOP|nr:jg18613 [Pararge aegeria aegeria]
MAWKVLTFLAIFALSEARPPTSEQKVKIENWLSHIGSHEPESQEEYALAYPSYEFTYEVSDPHTHDFKGQHEKRKGDEVNGYYWLIQPDGLKRTVKYRADKHSGFKAHVDYTKHLEEESNKEEREGEGETNEEESNAGENESENSEENENEGVVVSEGEGENENNDSGVGEEEENREEQEETEESENREIEQRASYGRKEHRDRGRSYEQKSHGSELKATVGIWKPSIWNQHRRHVESHRGVSEEQNEKSEDNGEGGESSEGGEGGRGRSRGAEKRRGKGRGVEQQNEMHKKSDAPKKSGRRNELKKEEHHQENPKNEKTENEEKNEENQEEQRNEGNENNEGHMESNHKGQGLDSQFGENKDWYWIFCDKNSQYQSDGLAFGTTINQIIIVLSVALYVQGEEDAISEQRVVIHHQKSFRSSPSHNGPNKSGNKDAYAGSYPSYEFSYNVNDPKTRDIKGQHETREGDEVTGNYWLIEPNGRKRTVNYQANDDNGFNAQIDYTATLKEEERHEDVSVSQEKGKDEGNLEKNSEQVVEISVAEEMQDIKDSNAASEDNGSLPATEESSSSDESDNQEDEANNIDKVERVNVDSNYDGHFPQNAKIFDNSDNNIKENNEHSLNKYSRGNLSKNVAKKGKNEKIKRNKDQGRISTRNSHESNRNINDGLKNSEHTEQDDSKQYENNNRNSNRRRKTNRGKNLNIPQNNNSEDTSVIEDKELINESLENFLGKQQGLRKEENNKEQNDFRNNKNYAFINFAPSDEIERKIDIPHNGETFEHRIRIYHPKFISPTPK